jgi:IMP dehydrogenase
MQKFVGEPIVPKERLPMTLYKAKSNSPLTYKPTFGQENFPIALTFDDVLLVPQYSKINSRSECSVASMFSKNVPLNVPIVSSPMDTVTETDMAVNMAKFGGLGILHRFNTIEEQARMVRRVKRSGAFINTNPLTIGPNETYKVVKDKISLHGISSFLVC